MPGRWIDCFVASISGAALFYLLFLGAGLGIALSAALSFVSTVLLRYVIEHRPRRYALTLAQAEDALEAMLRMDEAQSNRAVKRLAEAARLPEGAEIVVHLRHSSGRLSADDALQAWRAHRGEDRILIAATCAATQECRALASELRQPEVRLIDRPVLLRCLRRVGTDVPRDAPPSWRHRLRCRLASALRRRASPRVLLYGLGMLMLYLRSGRWMYLAASMILCFHVGACWIRCRLDGC